MINELTINQVIEINKEMTDGKGILTDPNGLESAVISVYQSVFGVELYPGIIAKGARLLYNISTTQYFTDGNKRTAVSSMLIFFSINGIRLKPNIESKLTKITLKVAQNKINYEKLVKLVSTLVY